MLYEEFKSAVVAACKANNLSEYELYYTDSDSLGISIFMQDEVDTYSSENTMGVCFRCIVDGKTGYASTENLSEEDAKNLVEHAIANAKSIENDDKSFIHKSGDTYATFEKEAWTMPSGKELIEFGKKIQKEVYAGDERVVDGTQTSVGAGTGKVAIYNSNGLDLFDETGFCYGYSIAIVSDGEERYNGIGVNTSTSFRLDEKKIAKEAVEEAISTIGATSLPTGKYKAVLSPEVMYTFLDTFGPIFYGESAQKGLSLLKGKEGEMIAAPIITIVDDPMEATSLSKRSFDDEGVATYKKNVIEKGQLKTLLYNLKSANVDGVKSTGNGFKAGYTAPVTTNTGSFYIQPGTVSKEDLYKQVGNGVLVTDISGMHAGANPISGDFSLVSEGYLITDGKKGAPIKNFTISGNFYSLLKEVKVLGNDFKFNKFAFGSSRCGSPSALFDEISVAGE